MKNEENESANIKARHPLTPKQDNRIFESIPQRPAPWSSTRREVGTAMNKERALGMFRTANQWLYDRLAEGATCECGCCFLCAYKFFEDEAAHQTFGDGHYCTHHPDDPVHNADCYDYMKFTATSSTRSLAAAEEIWKRINSALADGVPAAIKEAFGDDAAVQMGQGAIPKIAAIIKRYFPAAAESEDQNK